jgi:hypothetical protein
VFEKGDELLFRYWWITGGEIFMRERGRVHGGELVGLWCLGVVKKNFLVIMIMEGF